MSRYTHPSASRRLSRIDAEIAAQCRMSRCSTAQSARGAERPSSPSSPRLLARGFSSRGSSNFSASSRNLAAGATCHAACETFEPSVALPADGAPGASGDSIAPPFQFSASGGLHWNEIALWKTNVALQRQVEENEVLSARLAKQQARRE